MGNEHDTAAPRNTGEPKAALDWLGSATYCRRISADETGFASSTGVASPARALNPAKCQPEQLGVQRPADDCTRRVWTTRYPHARRIKRDRNGNQTEHSRDAANCNRLQAVQHGVELRVVPSDAEIAASRQHRSRVVLLLATPACLCGGLRSGRRSKRYRGFGMTACDGFTLSKPTQDLVIKVFCIRLVTCPESTARRMIRPIMSKRTELRALSGLAGTNTYARAGLARRLAERWPDLRDCGRDPNCRPAGRAHSRRSGRGGRAYCTRAVLGPAGRPARAHRAGVPVRRCTRETAQPCPSCGSASARSGRVTYSLLVGSFDAGRARHGGFNSRLPLQKLCADGE